MEKSTETRWELFDGERTEGPFSEPEVVAKIWNGLDPSTVARRAGEEQWQPIKSYPQFALAIERSKAKAAEETKPTTRRLWKRPSVTTLLVGAAILLVAFVVNTLWVGVGALLEANCNTNGMGVVSCLFTNRGYVPGSSCVTIHLMRARDPEGIFSSPICSGVLWPMSSTNVESRSAFVSQNPAEYCRNGMSFRDMGDRSWTDLCAFEVRPTR